jgi:hypothetical protein
VFFNGVFEKKPENLNLPLQTKIYKITSGSASNAMNLIQLQNGLPLLVRSNSNYSVFLFGSSLAPNFGNFTSNALFSTILLRSAEMSQRRIPIALTIGSDSKFPVYNAPKKFSLQGIENVKFTTIDEGQSIARIELEKPKEYWRIFVLLALLFVLTEMALIKFLKK